LKQKEENGGGGKKRNFAIQPRKRDLGGSAGEKGGEGSLQFNSGGVRWGGGEWWRRDRRVLIREGKQRATGKGRKQRHPIIGREAKGGGWGGKGGKEGH